MSFCFNSSILVVFSLIKVRWNLHIGTYLSASIYIYIYIYIISFNVLLFFPLYVYSFSSSYFVDLTFDHIV